MNFLISEEKRPIRSLFLIIMALIVACLFVLAPMKAFANDFYVVTQLPAQLDKRVSMLSGFVNNDSGTSAYVWFEYGRNGKFEKSSSKRKVRGTQDFAFRIYSLDPGVVYSYRIVGRKENSNVIKYGDTKTFIIDTSDGGNYDTVSSDPTQQTNNYSGQTSGQCVTCCNCPQTTSSIKPVAQSGGATATTNITATLHGVVLTGGVPTRGWFEWGTTRSLGRVTPAKKLGSASRVEMKETIQGLSSGTIYYYRIVAVAEAGISHGALMSFKTTGITDETIEAEPVVTQKKPFPIISNDINDGDNEGPFGDKQDQEKPSSGVAKQESDDSEKSVFAWGSTLRGQFFTIDEKGNIDTGISFNEPKKEKQNFLLASAAYSKRVLPDTWSEWGFITIFLYLIISRTHRFWEARKKRKKEKKEREEEMDRVRDTQLEQATNGGGVIV